MLDLSPHSEPDGLPEAGPQSLWRERLRRADLAAVRVISLSARPRVGRASAIAISKLGNSWLYLIIISVVFESLGRTGFRVVFAGALNVGLLHCLFPYIKRWVGRPRPFRVDPRLPSLLAVLDEHSFPSGHTMTLSGVLVPLVLVWPGTATSAATLIMLMAWSRIATGHHYPSDIVAGAILGVLFAYPISICILAIW
ncbi:MAG: phosphatase PAP2 family protein [Methylovirgula sp.]|jgi:membrane-associated phospholipid phosphatase